ncbi:DegQ family serine endoprotease [Alphaproteobacteria bacterium]|nr:DegQ family serine endoprotease [Alphaproteobacteria bacterium]
MLLNLRLNFFLLSFLILLVPFSSYAKKAPDSFASLAKALSPSVVNISTTTIIEDRKNNLPTFPPGSPFEEFFKQFQEPNQSKRRAQSLGSGFIIDKKGYIITNNHVIDNAEKIMVILHDDKSFEAEVVGKDPKTDVALLKINPKNTILKAVKFGNSNDLRVGDWVMAIGNPFGFGGTVTAGIVSARGRNIGGSYDDYIQTDASINRGNSGGPLFDMNGNVVGINTAIFSQSGGSVGIGFAVSSNLAKQVSDQLRKYGRTKRGWLGVLIQQITKEIADSLQLKNTNGALVSSATENGPAYKAGIKSGDIILKFNGIKIESMNELPKVVASTPVGKSVKVEIWREGKINTLTVILGELELAENNNLINNNPKKGQTKSFPRIGFEIKQLDDQDIQKYKIKEYTKGIIISKVKKNSKAFKSGLREGMKIVRVGQSEVSDLNVISNAIEKAKKQKRNALLMLVNFEGSNRFVAVEIF